METSLTFILNDTISCISLFLLPVIRVSSDHQVVTKCLLFKKLKSKVAKCISVFDTHQ